MSRTIEAFLNARKRISPEGLAFSGAVTLTSPAVLPTVSAGVTYAIHEIARETDPTLTRVLAIGIIGLLGSVSVAIETKALKSNEYSASPTSSTLYFLTGRPLLSSLGGHAVNYGQISIINPINIFSAATRNNELLADSEISSTLVLTSWLTTLNALVLKGKTKPFTDGVKKMRQKIGRRFNKES